MIQYTIPIRNNTPQVVGPYTFKDQNGNIISLVGYVSAFVELKLQGAIYAVVAASFVLPLTTGQVQLSSFTFTVPGMWNAQFYVQDGLGNKVFGEPIQFKVVANVEDLALSQLPTF